VAFSLHDRNTQETEETTLPIPRMDLGSLLDPK